MSRFVIQNMIYDTDKMKLVGTVRKWYEFRGWLSQQIFGEGTGRTYDCRLYRSDKGNWLLTHDDDTGAVIGEAIKEEEAKDLIMHSDYDAYTEYFGILEEA